MTAAPDLPTHPRQPRYLAVDALRGLAATHVLLYHFTQAYDHACHFPPPGPVLVPNGRQAVYLFFMISGFVILLTAERVAGAADFLRSRAARLYPAYWVCLAVTTVVVSALGLPGWQVTAAQVAANVTLFQAFVGVPSVDAVYWSLEVEVVFYGWVAVLLAARRLHWLPGVLVALMVVGAGWQTALGSWPARGGEAPPAAVRVARHMLLTSHVQYFALGTAVYLIRSGRGRVGAGLAVAAVAYSAGTDSVRHAAAGVVLVAVLGTAVWLQPRWLTSRPLLFLGGISYPLYLVHCNVGLAVIHAGLAAGFGNYPVIAAAVGVTGLTATAVSYAVERPAMRRLRRARP